MNLITVAKTSANASLASLAGATTRAERGGSGVGHAAEIKDALGELWMPRIYRERILRLRTRSHHLDVPARAESVEVQHTLLGVELKTGRRRTFCPDLATARYLAVFARAGCQDVAVPYDITQISSLADQLESSWHRMLLLIDKAAEKRSRTFRSRLRASLLGEVRAEITEAGAGTPVPQFNQNTKQRRAPEK
ncbi:MAG TPA: hypothetical protein VE842_06585 [Pyrinomonadaceae bacterium]|jgi:hypothetical protein|nr:hypothetical protein [Pyrinomonadaceae bacterium]